MSVVVSPRDWRTDQRDSAVAFRDIVWPEIYRYIGGGELRSFEFDTNNKLDQTGGLDGYQLLSTGIRTIAQRTQFIDEYDKPATFTIRYRRRTGAATEYLKRVDALRCGYDLPALVIQAYVHKERQFMWRVGITHGRPFYEYVFRQEHRWERNEARDGSAAFLVVKWHNDICRDNEKASDAEIVPLLMKDCMGTVGRSPKPDDWFDRHQYLTDLTRHSKLAWI